MQYITAVQRDDGFYIPCYEDPKTNSVSCKFTGSEPMYRVYNHNPKYVAPLNDKVDSYSYLIPASSFDAIVDDGLVKKHHFYDTHSAYDIANKRVVYDPNSTPMPDGACIRVSPCRGQAAELGVCCDKLVVGTDTPFQNDVEQEMKSYMHAFNVEKRGYLSFGTPQNPAYMTIQEDQVKGTLNWNSPTLFPKRVYSEIKDTIKDVKEHAHTMGFTVTVVVILILLSAAVLIGFGIIEYKLS